MIRLRTQLATLRAQAEALRQSHPRLVLAALVTPLVLLLVAGAIAVRMVVGLQHNLPGVE